MKTIDKREKGIRLATSKLTKEEQEFIDELNKSELAWTTKLNEIKNNNHSYEVIYEDDILNPWKLIIKK